MIHESPDLKLGWLREMSLLVRKKLNILLKIRFLKKHSTNWKQNNWTMIFHVLLIVSLFDSEGIIPVRRALLKINSNGLHIKSPLILSMEMLMLSCPCTLFKSRFRTIFPKSSTANVTAVKRLSVINLKLVGSGPLLEIQGTLFRKEK